MMRYVKIRINDDKLSHGMAQQALVNASSFVNVKFDSLGKVNNFKEFERALSKDFGAYKILSVCTSSKKTGSRSRGYAWLAIPSGDALIILEAKFDARRSNEPFTLGTQEIHMSKHALARMAQRFLHKMDLLMMLQELLPHISEMMSKKLPNACGAGHILLGEYFEEDINTILIKTYFSADMAKEAMLIVHAYDQNIVRAFLR